MTKKELIELTKELLSEEHPEERSDDLNFLKREYKYLLDRDEDNNSFVNSINSFLVIT